jgi:transposase-like protein
MKKRNPYYSPEVKERAVRLVQESRSDHPSQWSAIESVAPKIGCSPQTLLSWVQRSEHHQTELLPDEREELKRLRRENKELQRANDILRTASAFFAQAELDRKLKK